MLSKPRTRRSHPGSTDAARQERAAEAKQLAEAERAANAKSRAAAAAEMRAAGNRSAQRAQPGAGRPQTRATASKTSSRASASPQGNFPGQPVFRATSPNPQRQHPFRAPSSTPPPGNFILPPGQFESRRDEVAARANRPKAPALRMIVAPAAAATQDALASRTVFTNSRSAPLPPQTDPALGPLARGGPQSGAAGRRSGIIAWDSVTDRAIRDTQQRLTQLVQAEHVRAAHDASCATAALTLPLRALLSAQSRPLRINVACAHSVTPHCIARRARADRREAAGGAVVHGQGHRTIAEQGPNARRVAARTRRLAFRQRGAQAHPRGWRRAAAPRVRAAACVGLCVGPAWLLPAAYRPLLCYAEFTTMSRLQPFFCAARQQGCLHGCFTFAARWAWLAPL